MCFSLAWIESLCIYLIFVIGIVAIIRLVVPWLLAQLGGGGGIIAGIINIVLWMVVAIFVVYLCFALLSCIGGGGLPLFPHH